MEASPRSLLPLAPLLRAYTDAGVPGVEELGPRFRAIRAARGEFLSETFLDTAGEAHFQAALLRFYEACVQPALHVAALRRRAGVVRHALAHLLRCPDPLLLKAERCLVAGGAYHVPGLGPAFWSALFQALDPVQHPAWTPAVEQGLRRLGLARWRPQAKPARVYAAIAAAYDRMRALAPGLTALHVDHFLTLVAGMQGRDLFGRAEMIPTPLSTAIIAERIRVPLRQRLKERGRALQEARHQLESALAARNGLAIGAALAVADPVSAQRAPVEWAEHGEALTLWVGRLWEAEDPYERLEEFWRADPIPGAGLWLPAAVLHLRDARQLYPWDEASRSAYATLDDSASLDEPAGERYRLFNEGLARLREQHRLHPLEVPDVLAALAADEPPTTSHTPLTGDHRFGGFCADTFRFLAELGQNNRRDWMEQQRDRYRFAVREPLLELCRALAERYVEPVLRREHGWDLETTARTGRALTSVCKNDYGRSVPYHTTLWITFYRRAQGRHGQPDVRTTPARGQRGQRDGVQLFVRLDAAGLSYGLSLGRSRHEASRLFHQKVRDHAEVLYRALAASGALEECRFGDADSQAAGPPLTGGEELKAWADGRSPVASKTVPADAPLLKSDELVGDILLTFDRLLPAYACAAEPDPLPLLTRRAGPAAAGAGFTDSDFRRATYLDDDWLRRARSLLGLKRQLILQGVPGTGKTHVARCLARLLTGGRDEAVRLVQFHPAYSYEEFVEGIKVRSVEVNGRHEVTYPVEPGLLCAFAAEAARRPAEPHVLVIDEINRGNLPRIFGELLYLLEYREQAVRLPYSKQSFQLPANLYLIGTMNGADRSVAHLDQALRRRFSFLDMPPDAAVLTAWLRSHPPRAGAAFAETVAGLFERLNARLRAELGPPCQVGHSYFMVPELDEARLRIVWEHHVGPLLDEYCARQPAQAAAYDLDSLLAGRRSPRRETTGVPG